jgi:hypothetical protein
VVRLKPSIVIMCVATHKRGTPAALQIICQPNPLPPLLLPPYGAEGAVLVSCRNVHEAPVFHNNKVGACNKIRAAGPAPELCKEVQENSARCRVQK